MRHNGVALLLVVAVLIVAPENVLGQSSEMPYGMEDTMREDSVPFIENERYDAKVFVSVERADGTNQIVGIPPRSVIDLPADTMDVYFLYEEKTKGVWDEPPHWKDETDIGWGAQRGTENSKERTIKEAVRGLSRSAVDRDSPGSITNKGDKLAVVYIMTESKERHILVIHPEETVSLPTGSARIGLRPYATSHSKRKMRERVYIRLVKANGDRKDITEMGGWHPVA